MDKPCKKAQAKNLKPQIEKDINFCHINSSNGHFIIILLFILNYVHKKTDYYFVFVDYHSILVRAIEKWFDEIDILLLVNKTEENVQDFGKVLRK